MPDSNEGQLDQPSGQCIVVTPTTCPISTGSTLASTNEAAISGRSLAASMAASSSGLRSMALFSANGD
jgi:hypothetical protein